MNWNVRTSDKSKTERLSKDLGVPYFIAQLLVNRNIEDSDSARSFLKPDLNNLRDPFLLPGMKEAVQRIDKALQKKENIVIYGDYDTDGITATVLLKNMFKFLGFEVDFYIPHRLDEGYSLNKSALKKISKGGADLVITVDCGVSDLEDVKYAKKLGLDIIITDHHEPLRDEKGDALLPEADAVINPKLSPDYFTELSGVGVAFKLVWALTQKMSNEKKSSPEFQKFLAESIALVVVGTIADVVPLSDENRILTAYGIPVLRNTSIPWLDALVQTSRINRSRLNTRDISFRIGPRLNAGGRLGLAQIAVGLLLSDSYEDALELANQLEKANQQRQRIEKKILDSARKKIQKEVDLDDDYVIVLADKDWHLGVIGIVAAKIADEYNRPTVILSLKGSTAKGSARSIPSFHLYKALQACSSHLEELGGHSYAAGLSVKKENIEPFRDALNKYAKKVLALEDLKPSLAVDAEVDLKEISFNAVQLIQQLAPFGEGNAEPVIISRNVKIAGQPRLCGAGDNHCAFVVSGEQESSKKHSIRVIAFWMSKRMEELLDFTDKTFKIAYIPEINYWNNQTELVLNLKDFKADE